MIVILLAPGLAMYVTEHGKGRPLARSMLMMGAASTFLPLRLLWEQGGSLDASLALLADPARPLLSWVSSGLGWLLGQMTEFTWQFVLNTRAARQHRSLLEEQTKLLSEWENQPSQRG